MEQHVFSLLMGEGLALRSALLKCKDLGIRNLKYEADLSLLINSNKNRNTLLSWRIFAALRTILNLSRLIEFLGKKTEQLICLQNKYYLH
ncbi:LOW QUALITY PROTEIN: hypothetical protein HID58_021680, partial [Brassica napus]